MPKATGCWRPGAQIATNYNYAVFFFRKKRICGSSLCMVHMQNQLQLDIELAQHLCINWLIAAMGSVCHESRYNISYDHLKQCWFLARPSLYRDVDDTWLDFFITSCLHPTESKGYRDASANIHFLRTPRSIQARPGPVRPSGDSTTSEEEQGQRSFELVQMRAFASSPRISEYISRSLYQAHR